MYEYSVRTDYSLTEDGDVLVTEEIEYDEGGSEIASKTLIPLAAGVARLAYNENLTSLYYLYQECRKKSEALVAKMERFLEGLPPRQITDPDECSGLFSGHPIEDVYCELDSGEYLRWNKRSAVMYVYNAQIDRWEANPEGWQLFLKSEHFREYQQRYWFMRAAYDGTLRFTDKKPPAGWSPK